MYYYVIMPMLRYPPNKQSKPTLAYNVIILIPLYLTGDDMERTANEEASNEGHGHECCNHPKVQETQTNLEFIKEN